MTGNEFKQAIKNAGYTQIRFAEIMGVRRDTIGERYKKDVVEPYWIFALNGLIAQDNASRCAPSKIENGS